MTRRVMASAAAAFLATSSAAFATTIAGTTITGMYTAVSNPAVMGQGPTINDSGSGYTFLSSPFTENNLALNNTTLATPFIDVGPRGSGSGTEKGTIAVGFTLSDGTAVTGVTSTGNAATLVGGVIDVSAFYELFYNTSPQTDCITWSSTASCTATGNTTTIGDTLHATFADGAVLAINLYNWSDWVMMPDISFDLLHAPTPVAEPASLALLCTALGGLGLIRRRGHDAVKAETRPTSARA